MSRSDRDISVIGLGEIVTGKLFRIVDISVSSQRLNVKQEITIADVGLSLTEVHSDQRQKIPGLIVIKDIPPEATGAGRTAAAPTTTGDVWGDHVSQNWPVK